MPTIAEIVNVYPIAQYLAAIYIGRKGLYAGGKTVLLPQKIRNIGKSVQRIYDNDPGDSTLPLTANYLWTLCGIYGLQALSVIQQEGSISSIASISAITPYDFDVDATSFIATGDTTKVFPAAWRGRSILLIRAFTPQTTTIPSFGTYYSWDSVTAALTLLALAPSLAAAQATENFQIYPI